MDCPSSRRSAAARTGRQPYSRGGTHAPITRSRFRPHRGLALRERALGSDKSAGKSLTWTTAQIKEAQEGLAKAGFYKGKPTGQFNADTRKALKRYQKKNNLPVTGRLDNEVLNKLKSA